jgi:biopolymer transport protein ExbB
VNAWLEPVSAYWISGGILLLPIALVCLAIWGFYLRSLQVLVRTLRQGSLVEDALHGMRCVGSAPGVAAGIAPYEGGVAAMIRATVEDVQGGAAPREAFVAREAECMRLLERDLVVLAALTAVAPLLGLLGTVVGMISTFDAVAAIGGNTGTRVAAGISQALITTQFGLVVAVPGVFGLARLRRLLRNTQTVMAECRAHVLALLAGDGKEDGA